MRIDKFLWTVRLFKTRSQATDACKTNKVLVNSQVIKPAHDLKVGDIIQIKKNTAQFSYQVLAFTANRVGASLVPNYIKDTTPPSELEKYKTYQLAQREFRDFQTAKPSKSDRQKLRKFLDGSN
ncbi:MAG: RNA-binding S4 domain-containing protein [Crocinitomicaceae bacterium]|nr:RNA-binding S4 domain-containing protein [Crocinitomicaceae bacterium]MBK8927768.1 RNA-binding S4 domain-containing protein [Crocinitomicaceae bacterium]